MNKGEIIACKDATLDKCIELFEKALKVAEDKKESVKT